MSSPIQIDSLSSTPPSLLSPVSHRAVPDGSYQERWYPLRYLPRNKNKLDEPSNLEFFNRRNDRWCDLPLRMPDDYKPYVQVSTPGRKYRNVPELLKVVHCKYTGASSSAQYILGLRFITTTFVDKTPGSKTYKLRNDYGFCSMEVKKGPYSGAEFETEIINFNDVKFEGCASSGKRDPNLLYLEPERVWIPMFSIYELEHGEAIFVGEYQLFEMSIITLRVEKQEEHAPQVVILKKEDTWTTFDLEDSPRLLLRSSSQMSPLIQIDVSSSTLPSLLSPVSTSAVPNGPHQALPVPLKYLPRNKNELNELKNLDILFPSGHNQWYDLPLRQPVDRNTEPFIQMTTVDRPCGLYPELLKLKNCEYPTPPIFKFQVQNISSSVQYVLGLRFNTFMWFDKIYERLVNCHDFGFGSMEVRKGPYSGKELKTGIIEFNDVKLKGCASVQMDPNLILLEPGRVWIPVFSVYEWKNNEAILIGEFQVPDMSVTTFQEEEQGNQCKAPRAVPVEEKEEPWPCSDLEQGPAVRHIQDSDTRIWTIQHEDDQENCPLFYLPNN